MEGIWIAIIIIVAAGVGIIIGKYGVKVFEKSFDKKLRKNAIEVLEGKRENRAEIDGKIVDVDRFILKDDKGKKIRVSFKDGIVATEKLPSSPVQQPSVEVPVEPEEKKIKKRGRKKKDGKN